MGPTQTWSECQNRPISMKSETRWGSSISSGLGALDNYRVPHKYQRHACTYLRTIAIDVLHQTIRDHHTVVKQFWNVEDELSRMAGMRMREGQSTCFLCGRVRKNGSSACRHVQLVASRMSKVEVGVRQGHVSVTHRDARFQVQV